MILLIYISEVKHSIKIFKTGGQPMKKDDKSIRKEIDTKKNRFQKEMDEAVMKAIDKSFSKHKIFKKAGK
jgi:hypothetical protein